MRLTAHDLAEHEIDSGDFGDDIADLGAEAGDVPAEPEQSAAEPAASASPAWAPDPNEWQQLVGTVHGLAQALQPAEEELEPLDPYSEDFGQTLEQRLAMRDDRLIGQLREVLAPLHEQQAKSWVDEQIGVIPAELKHEFSEPALELIKGTGMQAPGNTDGMRWLASQLAAAENAAFARGMEAGKKSILGMEDDGPDGGPTAHGGATEIMEQPSSYDAIIAKHASRRNV
jgi:hypothetical protein